MRKVPACCTQPRQAGIPQEEVTLISPYLRQPLRDLKDVRAAGQEHTLWLNNGALYEPPPIKYHRATWKNWLLSVVIGITLAATGYQAWPILMALEHYRLELVGGK